MLAISIKLDSKFCLQSEENTYYVFMCVCVRVCVYNVHIYINVYLYIHICYKYYVKIHTMISLVAFLKLDSYVDESSSHNAGNFTF